MNIRVAVLTVLTLATVLVMARAVASAAAAADGSTRVALVIGNAAYPDSEAPLKEPINDARDVAAELKHDGFDVETGENLTGEAMRLALKRLYIRIKPGSVALIFFSGYGIQSGRQSYLIPVDAQLWTEADVRRDGFSLETILGEINNRGAGVKIALLDASRRNPFERRFRSFSAGLAPVIAPSGTLVMYSAALSSVFSDAGADHSLFVSELLKEIRVPGLTAEETLNRTRVGVTRASRAEQVPWISSSLAEDFYFIPGRDQPDVAATPSSPPTPQAESLSPPVAPAPPVAPPPPVPAPQATPAAASAPPPPAPESSSSQAPKPPAEPPPQIRDDKKTALALADDPTIKSLTSRIAARTDDANALYRRGQVYASKGAYALAIKDFDATIRLNPKDVEAYNNRCWTRTVIGELQSARRDCDKALKLRPGFVDALDSRGLLNLKSGANKDAIADFDAALKINPRLTSSLYGRGLARQRSGAVAEGNLDIANAKAMDPDIAKEFAGYGVR
ncbi:MAG: caspase family protein [Nitrobacter sp.]|uniref:caspase family protein n=1 Tax=Nitrobacter sp. TaxID=29420 RepID=UPI002626DA1F|nr:caspase family protein [Nitrobacter sp.]MCV0387344.1 caspase family protein [Nitrobacter sp.]